jgi:uncharacterized membrane protein
MNFLLQGVLAAIITDGIDQFLCKNFREVVITMFVLFIIAIVIISRNPKNKK